MNWNQQRAQDPSSYQQGRPQNLQNLQQNLQNLQQNMQSNVAYPQYGQNQTPQSMSSVGQTGTAPSLNPQQTAQLQMIALQLQQQQQRLQQQQLQSQVPNSSQISAIPQQMNTSVNPTVMNSMNPASMSQYLPSGNLSQMSVNPSSMNPNSMNAGSMNSAMAQMNPSRMTTMTQLNPSGMNSAAMNPNPLNPSMNATAMNPGMMNPQIGMSNQMAASSIPNNMASEQWRMLVGQQMAIQNLQQQAQQAQLQSHQPMQHVPSSMPSNQQPMMNRHADSYNPRDRNDQRGRDVGNNRQNQRPAAPAVDRYPRRKSPQRSPPRRARSPPRRANSPNIVKRSKSPERKPPMRKSPPRDHKRAKRSPTPEKKELNKERELERLREKERLEKERIEKEKERKYNVTVSPYSVIEQNRDYLNLKRRHPRMYISEDLSRVVSHWDTKVPMGTSFDTVSTIVPIHTELSHSIEKREEVDADPCPSMPKVKYSAKVVFTGGVSSSQMDDLTHNLKFLVGKIERSDLMLLGGPWSAELDGGDPAVDEQALIRCATRWFKEYTGLDLSCCSNWTRFMEVEYSPPEHHDPENREITVVFFVDVSPMAPTPEKFQADWNDKEEQNKAEHEVRNLEEKSRLEKEFEKDEAKLKDEISKLEEYVIQPCPENPGIFLRSANTDCAMISLNGLLDYNLEDKQETTMEVSLFAELFMNMLQRDYGNLILKSLEKNQRAKDEKKSKASQSSQVQVENPVKTENEEKPELNSQASQVQVENGDDAKSEIADLNAELPHDSDHSTSQASQVQVEKTEKVEPSSMEISQPQVHAEPVSKLDKRLLSAFENWDVASVGFIKSDDVEAILHSLGRNLTRYYVRHIVLGASDHSKVNYKHLANPSD
eukprot:TRINITY_DN2030_c0_g1_i4.p1 TRINITY_DN2030_c0_g1~~TRINITY_DN2030_c0_g1_i4.p1  ORF type:complete len:880 (+),score=266.45 TRINITY_DN2030_c0_g1_i4:163-2802(+)